MRLTTGLNCPPNIKALSPALRSLRFNDLLAFPYHEFELLDQYGDILNVAIFCQGQDCQWFEKLVTFRASQRVGVSQLTLNISISTFYSFKYPDVVARCFREHSPYPSVHVRLSQPRHIFKSPAPRRSYTVRNLKKLDYCGSWCELSVYVCYTLVQ